MYNETKEQVIQPQVLQSHTPHLLVHDQKFEISNGNERKYDNTSWCNHSVQLLIAQIKPQPKLSLTMRPTMLPQRTRKRNQHMVIESNRMHKVEI